MTCTIDDALQVFTEGQMSALRAYWATRSDSERGPQTLYHLQAWDRHLGRKCTIKAYERYQRAREKWDGYIFSDGAGI